MSPVGAPSPRRQQPDLIPWVPGTHERSPIAPATPQPPLKVGWRTSDPPENTPNPSVHPTEVRTATNITARNPPGPRGIPERDPAGNAAAVPVRRRAGRSPPGRSRGFGTRPGMLPRGRRRGRGAEHRAGTRGEQSINGAMEASAAPQGCGQRFGCCTHTSRASHRSFLVQTGGDHVVGDAYGDQEDVRDGTIPHGSVHQGQPLPGRGREVQGDGGLFQKDDQRLSAPQHLLDVLVGKMG